jgi:DNA-binding beta-propeller fold protein YncE
MSVAVVGALTVIFAGVLPAEAGAAALSAKLVRTTSTAKFAPSSPDPAGITYSAKRNRLIISDSEVEEMSIYKGVNLFVATRAGKLTGGSSSLRFSAEPTGIDVRPSNDHLFISDDQADRIYEVARGPDGRYGTSDDTVTSFSTRKAGNKDPEDVTVDDARGHLLAIDGSQAKVYRYEPGANRRFDGVDDKVSSFDVGRFGAKDPEGIAYDEVRQTVLVLDHKTDTIYELTREGRLLNTIGISAAKPVVAAGLTVAPASNGSGARNLYVVDRGLDNDAHPKENDGRLHELSVRWPPL